MEREKLSILTFRNSSPCVQETFSTRRLPPMVAHGRVPHGAQVKFADVTRINHSVYVRPGEWGGRQTGSATPVETESSPKGHAPNSWILTVRAFQRIQTPSLPQTHLQLSALLKDPQPLEVEGYLVKHFDLWAVF